MNQQQKEIITELILENLHLAEHHWGIGGHMLVEKAAATNDSISMENFNQEKSQIPGFDFVNDKETIITDFIAIVADMRKSSEHLFTNIAYARVTNLQRVYYETSALLPAIAQTIEFYDGSVTEYLGDGVLALFSVNSDSKWDSILNAYNAASDIIGDMREILNCILKQKYNLQPLDLGVGLSMSPMLVTLVGLDGKKQPKAIGNCIYKATKLSDGTNQVIVDEAIYDNWKTSPGGKRQFTKRPSSKNSSIIGFVVK